MLIYNHGIKSKNDVRLACMQQLFVQLREDEGRCVCLKMGIIILFELLLITAAVFKYKFTLDSVQN